MARESSVCAVKEHPKSLVVTKMDDWTRRRASSGTFGDYRALSGKELKECECECDCVRDQRWVLLFLDRFFFYFYFYFFFIFIWWCIINKYEWSFEFG